LTVTISPLSSKQHRLRLVVCLAIGGLIVATALIAVLRALDQEAQAWAQKSVSEVGRTLDHIAGRDLSSRLTVAQAYKTRERDPSTWGFISVPLNDVDILKEAIHNHFRAGGRPDRVSDEDSLDRLEHLLERAPAWWNPNEYPDADVLRVDYEGAGHVFIFSKSRGVLLMLGWTT
jgi:hypothetical protein